MAQKKGRRGPKGSRATTAQAVRRALARARELCEERVNRVRAAMRGARTKREDELKEQGLGTVLLFDDDSDEAPAIFDEWEGKVLPSHWEVTVEVLPNNSSEVLKRETIHVDPKWDEGPALMVVRNAVRAFFEAQPDSTLRYIIVRLAHVAGGANPSKEREES